MAEKKKVTWQEVLNASAEAKGKTKIGEYQEAAGGGTPMTKGQKVDYIAEDPQDAKMYKKDHPGSIVRVKQPRDEDGQFTYNSANKRELEYGPSRGKTIPPFLKDVKITFAQKSGKGSIVLDDKKYKSPVEFKSVEEFAKMFQEYSKKDDSFVGAGSGKEFGKTGDTAKGMGGKVGTNTTTVGQNNLKKAKGNVNFVKKSTAPSQQPKAEETKPQANPFEGAKADVEKFKQEHKQEVEDFYGFANTLGYDESDFSDEFWTSVGDSGIDNFNELKTWFKKLSEED